MEDCVGFPTSLPNYSTLFQSKITSSKTTHCLSEQWISCKFYIHQTVQLWVQQSTCYEFDELLWMNFVVIDWTALIYLDIVRIHSVSHKCNIRMDIFSKCVETMNHSTWTTWTTWTILILHIFTNIVGSYKILIFTLWSNKMLSERNLKKINRFGKHTNKLYSIDKLYGIFSIIIFWIRVFLSRIIYVEKFTIFSFRII